MRYTAMSACYGYFAIFAAFLVGCDDAVTSRIVSDAAVDGSTTVVDGSTTVGDGAATIGDGAATMPPTGAPGLLFSDLIDAPISGWEGSATRGAAVSIWGYNFGSQREASTVTVCGVTLDKDSDFAEWGATENPKTADNQQRITFWLNADMQLGESTIVVTNAYGDSRAIPFYCRNTGTIYFVDPEHGDDAFDGLFADPSTAPHGPKRTTGWARGHLQAGDIAYLRGGLYKDHDSGEFMFHNGGLMTFGDSGGTPNHQNGEPNASIAVTAYPGELVDMQALTPEEDTSALRSAIRMAYGGTMLAHWVFSKFQINGTHSAIALGGMPSGYPNGGMSNLRIIGIDATTPWSETSNWGCIVNLYGSAKGAEQLHLYGNYLHDQLADYRGHIDDSKRAYQLYIGGYGELDHVYLGYNEFGWGSQGRGVQIYGHESTDSIDNLYVHDNYFHHNNRQCMILGGGDTTGENYGFVKNAYFYNNVVVYPGEPADEWVAIVIGGVGGGRFGGNYFIYNNTFVGASVGFPVFNITGHIDSCILRNNIIIAAPNNYGYYTYHPDTQPAGLRGDHNLYFGLDESKIPAWDTSTLRSTDPKFVADDPQTLAEFMVSSTSAAVNGGSEADLSATVATDIYQIARPQGKGYDIGAFENVN